MTGGRREVRRWGARVAVRWALLLPVLCLQAGCAHTGYLADRRRDAADVATLTLGIGAGAKLRLGPVQAAAFENSDLIGLRAGRWLVNGNDLVFNDERYAPIPAWGEGFYCGSEAFSYGMESLPTQRGKEVLARSPFPFIVKGSSPHFYSQLEVAGGLLFTVRAGLNPGELLDFLLGWGGVDLFADDLSGAAGTGDRESRFVQGLRKKERMRAEYGGKGARSR